MVGSGFRTLRFKVQGFRFLRVSFDGFCTVSPVSENGIGILGLGKGSVYSVPH